VKKNGKVKKTKGIVMIERSFLKWVGGKRNALSNLMRFVPNEGGVLVEPFMGSCTVALNTHYERYILNDYNPDLVFLCQWVAKRPKEVIEKVSPLFSGEYNNRSSFEKLRRQYNHSKDRSERALIFLYLNRHGYNGLMRYNQSGGFNTPFGRYLSPTVPASEMLAFSRKFKKARFVCSSYRNLKFVSSTETTVYCDPPYLPVSPTASFAAYTALGFSVDEHKALNKKARQWAARGDRVFISNHDVPLLSTYYKSAKNKSTFMVARTVSSSIGNRIPVKEALLSY
jgi:DNA adenine methylase